MARGAVYAATAQLYMCYNMHMKKLVAMMPVALAPKGRHPFTAVLCMAIYAGNAANYGGDLDLGRHMLQ